MQTTLLANHSWWVRGINPVRWGFNLLRETFLA